MLELTNLQTSSMNLINQESCKEVSLKQADKIKGCGIFSGAGLVLGGLTGGTFGLAAYPAGQAYNYAVTGENTFNAADYGRTIAENAAGTAAVGAGFGKLFESGFKP